MSTVQTQLSVWTEGLSEEWLPVSGQEGRIQREPMEPEEVAAAVRRIDRENSGQAEFRFILRGNGKLLHLVVNRGKISISDPDNANYQNVQVEEDVLERFLGGYFFPHQHTPVPLPEVRTSHVRLLEGIIAVVVIAVFLVTVKLVLNHIREETGFWPKPEVKEIGKAEDSRLYRRKYSGIYVTRVRDGGMLIELKEGGSWAFYELVKRESGNFRLNRLYEGQYRPVMEGTRLALLTDQNFLFYPSESQSLEFLQKAFSRIGVSRDELPYLNFPE